MKTLTLMRHAKAELGGPGIADHDRKLRLRGIRSAAAVGQASRDDIPDLVLCSTSARTRETLDGLIEAWGRAPAIDYDRMLYLVPGNNLLHRIAKVSDEVGSVWIIGHNPGIHHLAKQLMGADTRFPDLAQRFQTASRAIFALDEGSWADFGTRPCRMVELAPAPKD
ncbi:MAG TPA: histidine phosphatase family protein [Stellaceae bacterium]|nr:histidine phosphatase family protein [Stellaceae bacterium]